MKPPPRFNRIVVLALAATLCSLYRPSSAGAQTQSQWEPANIPFRYLFVRSMFVDPIEDKLYFAGTSSIDNDLDMSDEGIAVYSNGQWDTLGVFNNLQHSIIRWHDTLLVSGAFSTINGEPIVGCAAYANGTWSQFGNWDSEPYRFRVIDDELYAVGGFTQVDENTCAGVAKLVGGTWWPVGDPSNFDLPDPLIVDIIKYDGHLVIAGSGPSIDGEHSIAQLNGDHWEIIGNGIQGNFGGVNALAVYQGDLYVGGSINPWEGNITSGIMRWDGQQFHEVGGGVWNIQNGNPTWAGVREMEVHDGKLYMCGQFNYAEGLWSDQVIAWDGQHYCRIPGDAFGPTNSIEFFHDTLYAAVQGSVDSIDCNGAARFRGTAPIDSCAQSITGILGSAATQTAIQAYVTESGCLAVSGLAPGQQPYHVYDVSGRLVYQDVLRAQSEERTLLPLGPLSTGCYVLRTAQGHFTFLKP